jgi:asparagine N-glycosylation enzyme membrane subunit Stt3
MYRKRYKRAQSLIEYAILLCVVISALLLMSAYIKRAYSGRIKADADSISQRQYSPYHTTSKIETTVTTTSESCSGTHCLKSDTYPGIYVPSGVTAEWTETDAKFDQREAVDAFAKD